MLEMEPAPGGYVLVIDDEAGVRAVLARWLTEAGYRCLEAACGYEAWNLLQRHEVSVVTLDAAMPGGSGKRLLARIVERFPAISVIMVTREIAMSAAIQSLTAGACSYLIKPVRRDQLRQQVRAAFERRQTLLQRGDYTRTLEKRVHEQMSALRTAQEEVIRRLVAACTFRDNETGAHVCRTGLLSEVLARAAGWSVEDAERLRLAAPMHDIGKIGIPDAILHKPSRLTLAEFEVMKQHTRIGEQILAGSCSPVLEMAQSVALCHHERWDGAGYPTCARGTDIPEAARIVAIVDVYDALTHARVYRPALAEDHALGKMRAKSGTHFDPELLSLFFEQLPALRQIAADHQDEVEVQHLFKPFNLDAAPEADSSQRALIETLSF